MHTLYYVHDPMCSWCYAFAPTWSTLQAQLPASIQVERLLGGLAPDTQRPMEEAMRQRIEQTWQRIERAVPGTRFNFDFWQRCTPYRSTYPSCRAVIAASEQGEEHGVRMTQAIQHAYYQQARNPSELSVLIELAGEIGLNPEQFSAAMTSPKTEAELQRQLAFTRAIGVDSYPSLVLATGNSRWPIGIDYNDAAPMLDTLHFLLEEEA